MSIDSTPPRSPTSQHHLPEALPGAGDSAYRRSHRHSHPNPHSPPNQGARAASPPTAVPYARLPSPSRLALQRGRTNTASVLMPRTASDENRQEPASAIVAKLEKSKEEPKDADRDLSSGHGQREWGEGDYAYEYVPVSQRKEGRHNISYEMSMRQQPVQARMCGVGEKSDRRPVDPTPIIQLKVIDKNTDDVKITTASDQDDTKRKLRRPDPVQGMSFMQNPYYFLFACLVGGDEQEDELHVIEDGKTRFLTGTPVSSLYHLKDLDNSDAAFFVFPDLGVRKEGRYKLKLTLFEIVEQEVYYCTTMYTSTFSVYSAKKFPGMQSATDLSRSFAEQGLKIRVRKDPRKRNAKMKRKSSANESEDDVIEAFPKRSRNMSASEHPHVLDHHHPSHGYYPPDVYHQHPSNAYPRQGAPMPPPPMPHESYRHPPQHQYSHPGPYPGQPYYQQGGRPQVPSGPSGPSQHRHSVPAPGYYAYPQQPPHPQHAYPAGQPARHSPSYSHAHLHPQSQPHPHTHTYPHPHPHLQSRSDPRGPPGHPGSHDAGATPPTVPWPQQDRHSHGPPPLTLHSPGRGRSPPLSSHPHRVHDISSHGQGHSSRTASADLRLPPISAAARPVSDSARVNELGRLSLPILASEATTKREQSSARSSPVVPREEGSKASTSTDGSPRSTTGTGRGANKMGLGHLVD